MLNLEFTMAAKTLPPQALLLQLLRYESETGLLFWKERPVEMFAEGFRSAAHNAAIWNTRYAGKQAFTADNGMGYRQGCIFGVMHKAHRIIFKMVNGFDPIEVDHDNGGKPDNRSNNLGSVTHAGNMKNKSIYACNKSGVTGVGWHKRDKTWAANIRINGKSIHLGYFDVFSDAVAARKAAEIRHGFHTNHGRSTRS